MDDEEKLHRIRQWCDAYPLDIFPEPDLVKARGLLEAGGMTLDAISASNMRFVLEGVRKIIDEKQQHRKAKVTEQDVRDIRALRAAGTLYREITERYGLKAPALHDMITRKTWKHVN